MASDHGGVSRRRLLNLVVLAVAMLVTGMGSLAASVGYANMTAHRQDSQQRTQDKTIAQLRVQLQASCGFAHDLGTATLPAAPRPSRFGVSLVVDARAQWRALHCPGELPVPPGLARWAAFYHLDGS
jgi:hypothetical protein